MGSCSKVPDDNFSDTVKSNNYEDAGKKYKIGLSLPSFQEDRWLMDLKVIKEECERLDIELIYENADMNAERQVTQCSSMIMKGIQILI